MNHKLSIWFFVLGLIACFAAFAFEYFVPFFFSFGAVILPIITIPMGYWAARGEWWIRISISMIPWTLVIGGLFYLFSSAGDAGGSEAMKGYSLFAIRLVQGGMVMGFALTIVAVLLRNLYRRIKGGEKPSEEFTA